jgi:hypothetical protein
LACSVVWCDAIVSSSRCISASVSRAICCHRQPSHSFDYPLSNRIDVEAPHSLVTSPHFLSGPPSIRTVVIAFIGGEEAAFDAMFR